MATFDCVIVGAGIVGLSVAWELKRRHPALSIAVLEKESQLGLHASGRNSGVLHCGIYYGSDTLKAKVCATGAARMMEFATAHNILFRQDGKLILATEEAQLPALEKLMHNASANAIRAERVSGAAMRAIEPYAADGEGIYCPTTAIIDSKEVLSRLRALLQGQGVSILLGHSLNSLPAPGTIRTSQGDISYGYLINCAGSYADAVAKQYGLAREFTLLPFKGIYWKLSPAAAPRIRANIYPVPDPALPFLGVHFTRSIHNDVYIGPTAIPALGRENYGIVSGAKPAEAARTLSALATMYVHNHQNFRALAHAELAKYRKSAFFRAARRLMPSLTPEEMLPAAKVGIRPQLFNTRTKRLEMDYILAETPDSLHVLNAISPAFTSAFAFAETIVNRSIYGQTPPPCKGGGWEGGGQSKRMTPTPTLPLAGGGR